MREIFIERVLDPILINAASDNEDVAFILINIPGLARSSATGTEVCACILEQFVSSERIFEHGNDSFAVILQNSDEAEAIQIASGLYRKLSEIISGSETVPVISIGISSKAIRDSVAAATLLMEANQALSRAIENQDTPIIALKINPEKYREFREEG
jgi:GGDEF domain-containing protein